MGLLLYLLLRYLVGKNFAVITSSENIHSVVFINTTKAIRSCLNYWTKKVFFYVFLLNSAVVVHTMVFLRTMIKIVFISFISLISMSSVGGQRQSCGYCFLRKYTVVCAINQIHPGNISCESSSCKTFEQTKVLFCVFLFIGTPVIGNRTLCDISCESTIVHARPIPHRKTNNQ